jgi:transposase
VSSSPSPGHFIWPKQGDITWMLSPEQFDWLMKGVDWVRVARAIFKPMEIKINLN